MYRNQAFVDMRENRDLKVAGFYPYNKVEFVQNDVRVSHLTADKYLEWLTDQEYIEKHKIGRYHYYANRPLMSISMDEPEMPGGIVMQSYVTIGSTG